MRQGWIRGVGSCAPYFHLRTRGGLTSTEVNQAVANLEIHELPAARGCTYIVPEHHFALALALSRFPGDEAKMDSGERNLGFTWEQIESLKTAVLEALKDGPADPRQLKEALGSRVKSYGAEGKKYGITTDLPGVLGRLQKEGRIRRIPDQGRLDNERYSYTLWTEGPLESFAMTKPELHASIAGLYFDWVGPATLEEFTWFTGFSKRDAKSAIDANEFTEREPGLLGSQKHFDLLDSFEPNPTPCPHFLTSLDNLILLTRNLSLHVDGSDWPEIAKIEGKGMPTGGLSDLENHAIIDRGRLIGLWAYDVDAQQVVYSCWAGDRDLVAQRAKDTEAFIQSELGDARSFSLDSPKSRSSRIDRLRQTVV